MHSRQWLRERMPTLPAGGTNSALRLRKTDNANADGELREDAWSVHKLEALLRGILICTRKSTFAVKNRQRARNYLID